MKTSDGTLFESDSIWRILLRIAPPVMLAQLIQALYNIVDSYFVGKFSGDGLTALSVLFPIQFLITAFSVGTGVGVNTFMARLYAQNKTDEANKTAGTGMVLAVIMWILFAAVLVLCMKPYVMASANTPQAVDYAITYGNIVCVGSLGIFLESIWTKVLQAGGNMRIPMFAQVAGAIINIILDPLLIFGFGSFTGMGIAGAALATVIGQFSAAIITAFGGVRKPPKIKEMLKFAKPIYRYGYPQILMQILMTLYIIVLNIILAGFSDAAVTVLGLYYKMQTFFFIPLMALQTCIVPMLSYNYTRNQFERCRKVMSSSILMSVIFMLLGIFCFEFLPETLINIFSKDAEVMEIGTSAFRIIGLSFFSAVFSLIMPVFFQAIGKAKQSVVLSLTRQIFCLIPIFWFFSLFGVQYTWIAFPASETITGAVGLILYFNQIRKWKNTVPPKIKSL